jgi:catechol 2,3-dioxygenase-like lactoylglutathione lyase family enzyme
MIRVKKIAHAIYEMPDVDKQTEYYTEVLGLTETGKDKDAVYLASTVDHHSVVLRKGAQAKCVRLGFQIAPDDDLDALEKEVRGHGIKTERQKDPQPSIAEALTFQDPKGTVMEVFKRDAFSGQRFPRKGIVPHKLGHVAFFVTDVLKVTKFYCDVLGFRESDRMGDFF